MRKTLILSSLCLIALSACAPKEDTFATLARAEGAQYTNVAKNWEKGDDLIEEGTSLVKKGKNQNKKGRDLMQEGDDNVRKGNRMIKKGELLKIRAEKEYKMKSGLQLENAQE